VQAELDKVSKELENVGEDREALKIALLAKETQLLAIKLSKETYLRGMAKGIDCRSPFASFTHSYSHLLRQYSLRQ
jgi:hypothetical protein